MLWAKVADAGQEVGPDSEVNFWALAADKNSNLYLAGTVVDSVTFDNQTLVRDKVGGDPFIAKIDPQGNLEWVKAFKSSNPLGRSSAIHTMEIYNGKGYFGGFIYDGVIGKDTINSSFIAQFELDGTVNWAEGFNSGQVLSHLAFNEDGIYAGQNGNISIEHLDFSGNRIWSYINRSNSYASLHSLTLDSLDNVSIMGRFNGPMRFGDSFYFSADRQFYMANIINCNDFEIAMEPSSNQIVIWDTQGVDIVASIPEKYTVSDYNWYRDGKLSNKDSSVFSLKPPYPDFVKGAGVKLIAEGKYGCIDSSDLISVTIKDTGTSIYPEYVSETLKTWPNPVSNTLSVKLEKVGGSQLEISIINNSGQLVYEKEFPSGSDHINILTNELKPGIYILQVKAEDEVLGQEKFVKN